MDTLVNDYKNNFFSPNLVIFYEVFKISSTKNPSNILESFAPEV